MPDKKKIIVTGGAGYIGSHTVVELFNAGYEPIIIDNFSNAEKNVIDAIVQLLNHAVKWYEGDCREEDFLRKVLKEEKDVAGIIHFAASKAVGESVVKPLLYYDNNVGSLLVLLRVMKEFNINHFVFSSSCTVYGQPDKLPVTELSEKKPAESPYGNTKKICEDIIEDYAKSLINRSDTAANIKAISLRYFNPVGAHPSSLIGELPLGVPNNLIPFVTQTAAGIREKVTVFGEDYNTPDGTCIRDYIHVVDLAKAHVKSLQYLESKQDKSLYDVFNVGTGRGNTVLEVLKTFEKVSGQKLNYAIGSRRPGDIEKVYANVDKAETLLGWKAEKLLENALEDSWNWQKKLMERND